MRSSSLPRKPSTFIVIRHPCPCFVCPRPSSPRQVFPNCPAASSAAERPSPDFVGRCRNARLGNQAGGSQVNKTGRKPSKNNAKGKKMAVAAKPAMSMRHKAKIIQAGRAKAAVATKPGTEKRPGKSAGSRATWSSGRRRHRRDRALAAAGEALQLDGGLFPQVQREARLRAECAQGLCLRHGEARSLCRDV